MVAIVSTCQRRRSRSIASERKRTNSAPLQPTGCLRISRLSQVAARAAVSPTVLAKRLLESPAANPATIAMRMINAINATTSSVLFLPPSAASAARATTGNPYFDGLAPEVRQCDREPDRAPFETPTLEHPELGRHPDRSASRRDLRQGRGGERHPQRVYVAEPGEGGHPGRRIAEHIDDGDGEKGHDPLPRQRLHDIPNVAVAGDLRQHHGKDETDDRNRDNDPDDPRPSSASLRLRTRQLRLDKLVLGRGRYRRRPIRRHDSPGSD